MKAYRFNCLVLQTNRAGSIHLHNILPNSYNELWFAKNYLCLENVGVELPLYFEFLHSEVKHNLVHK